LHTFNQIRSFAQQGAMSRSVLRFLRVSLTQSFVNEPLSAVRWAFQVIPQSLVAGNRTPAASYQLQFPKTFASSTGGQSPQAPASADECCQTKPATSSKVCVAPVFA
jgi:hypothetical protein